MTTVIDGIRGKYNQSTCIDCITENSTTNHQAHGPDQEQSIDGIKVEEDNYAQQTVPVYAQTNH